MTCTVMFVLEAAKVWSHHACAVHAHPFFMTHTHHVYGCLQMHLSIIGIRIYVANKVMSRNYGLLPPIAAQDSCEDSQLNIDLAIASY